MEKMENCSILDIKKQIELIELSIREKENLEEEEGLDDFDENQILYLKDKLFVMKYMLQACYDLIKVKMVKGDDDQTSSMKSYYDMKARKEFLRDAVTNRHLYNLNNKEVCKSKQEQIEITYLIRELESLKRFNIVFSVEDCSFQINSPDKEEKEKPAE